MSRGGAHRAPPEHRRGRLTRAAVAAVAAVVLLLGAQGTLSFWSDRATVTGGQFTSGTLNLTVDNQEGNPTPYAKTSLTLTGMLPGESVAAVVQVRNTGTAPFTWTATATTSNTGTTDLGPFLTVQMYLGSAATNTSSYPRTGTCTTTTAPVGSGSTSTRLNAGTVGQTGQALCVRVALPSGVLNEAQGKTTGAVTIRLDATQALP